MAFDLLDWDLAQTCVKNLIVDQVLWKTFSEHVVTLGKGIDLSIGASVSLSVAIWIWDVAREGDDSVWGVSHSFDVENDVVFGFE